MNLVRVGGMSTQGKYEKQKKVSKGPSGVTIGVLMLSTGICLVVQGHQLQMSI